MRLVHAFSSGASSLAPHSLFRHESQGKCYTPCYGDSAVMRLADGHDERLGLLGAGAFMRLETGGLGVPALMSVLLSALMSALRGEAFWVLGLIMAVSPVGEG